MKKAIKHTLKISLAMMLALIFAMNIAVVAMAEDGVVSTDGKDYTQTEGDTAAGGDVADNTNTDLNIPATDANGDTSTNTDASQNWNTVVDGYEYTSVLRTEAKNISYSADGESTHEMIVSLDTNVPVSSFDLEFDMPYFVDVQGVSFGNSIVVESSDATWYEGTLVRANHVSVENYEGHVELLRVVFTVNWSEVVGSNSRTPNFFKYDFINDALDYVYPDAFDFGEIFVTDDSVSFMLGDVDNNGVIDMYDLTIIQRQLAYRDNAWSEYDVDANEDGLLDFGEYARDRADVDKNGDVNIRDCQLIKMLLVGKISSFDEINGGSNEGGDVPVPTKSIIYINAIDARSENYDTIATDTIELTEALTVSSVQKYVYEWATNNSYTVERISDITDEMLASGEIMVEVYVATETIEPSNPDEGGETQPDDTTTTVTEGTYEVYALQTTDDGARDYVSAGNVTLAGGKASGTLKTADTVIDISGAYTITDSEVMINTNGGNAIILKVAVQNGKTVLRYE